MNTLTGIEIVIDPAFDDVPRMQVSRRFEELMPEDFVLDLNDWMRRFFGTECRAILIGDRAVAVGPKGYEALKRECAASWTEASA
ncbi:hypothetical protein WJ63_08030 [Burkholderia pyrrocinia]|nr:hypothetical protein WJ63_08030 [Burkholderia pyrrocinia]